MKKLSSFILATLLFISTLLSIAPSAFAQATAKPADDQVILFKDVNFQGASQQLGVGSYDIKDLTFGKAQLSSLKVPSGYKVTLYENGGFQGKSKSFTSNAEWVGDDFNDIASSVKIEPEATAKLSTKGLTRGHGRCMPGSQLLPLGNTAINLDRSPIPKS